MPNLTEQAVTVVMVGPMDSGYGVHKPDCEHLPCLMDHDLYTVPVISKEDATRKCLAGSTDWPVVFASCIASELPDRNPTTLIRWTTEDAEALIGRPLTAAEIERAQKALPFSTMGEAFETVIDSIANPSPEDR